MNCKVITNGRVCCEGDLEVLLSNTTNLQNAGRWSIVFFTGGLTCSIPEKYVIASYDGTTYSNCRRVDNGNILCYFRSPKLGSGQLCYKLYLGIADSDFSPNFRDDVYPVATNYELGPWPTDSVRAELDLLVLSGIINAQIVGATAETLPAGSQATVTLGGTATERTFAFGIPAGADGADGEAAQITSATASVDDTTGTPSVNIELGGTPEKRTFDFKFSGLKGEPGEPDESFVRYDKAQSPTTSEQNQALENIGADLMVIDLVNGQAVLTEEQEARLLSCKGVILRGTVNAGKEVLTKIYFSDYQGGDQVSFWAVRNNRYILQCIYTKSTKLFCFFTSASFIDPNAVSIKAQTLNATEQAQARTNIKAARGQDIQNITGYAPTLSIVGGVTYVCGELTTLTVNSIEDSTDESWVYFTSGSTPTVVTWPTGANIAGDTTIVPNVSYEVCIRKSRIIIVHYEQS